MRTNIYHKMWKVALTMVLGILMVACSEDEIQDTKMSRKLHLVMGTQNITDVTDLTRALPTDYQSYSTFYGSTLPTSKKIQAFLVKPGDTNVPSITTMFTYGQDNFNNTTYNCWSSYVNIDDPNNPYYLYGFMPREAASGANIARLESTTPYADGAVLTINGINAVTPHDVCVIVGVKGYTPGTTLPSVVDVSDTDGDMTTRLGKFDIKVPEVENYAYLLVDHIFCSFNFKLKIAEQYSKLRTIKVKTMKLEASTDGSLAHLIKKVKATITLRKTDDNTSPLAATGSIDIEATEYGEPDPAMLYDESEHKDVNDKNVPLTLTTSDQNLRGYLAPAAIGASGIEKFVLETTYDVYDRKGNLIRAGETATNTFAPMTLTSALRPGEEFTFKITVTPTYLYMLSEPDLDSPTFTIQ